MYWKTVCLWIDLLDKLFQLKHWNHPYTQENISSRFDVIFTFLWKCTYTWETGRAGELTVQRPDLPSFWRHQIYLLSNSSVGNDVFWEVIYCNL